MEKKTFLVKLNYYGEVHSFYTTSTTPTKALGNAMNRLAKKMKVSIYYINNYLLNKDKHFVIEAKRP